MNCQTCNMQTGADGRCLNVYCPTNNPQAGKPKRTSNPFDHLKYPQLAGFFLIVFVVLLGWAAIGISNSSSSTPKRSSSNRASKQTIIDATALIEYSQENLDYLEDATEKIRAALPTCDMTTISEQITFHNETILPREQNLANRIENIGALGGKFSDEHIAELEELLEQKKNNNSRLGGACPGRR